MVSMKNDFAAPTTRRDFLRLSAGALLALGLAPGCVRWRDGGRGGNFAFVVINDAHFSSPRCPEFFERVRAKVTSHPSKPEFCLMVGDLAEHGTQKEIGGMREVLNSLKMPWHAVPGNHDYIKDTDRSAYDTLVPKSLNYHFNHRGWQIVALDSTEGTHAKDTKIQPATLQWTDSQLPKLSRKQPTILFTHFPLGPTTPMRPVNADDLLARFLDFNLVAVFNGHHHGFTERKVREAVFTTNRCCSISRGNHDKTKEKGYFLCTAKDGLVSREFIQVSDA
jgi:calcineurin-like phosphoesterase family protein